MRVLLVAGLVALTVFAAVSAALAQSGTPRRPKPPPWMDETAGWQTGAAVKSGAAPSALDRGDGLTLQDTPDSSAKYLYGTAFAAGASGLWLTSRQHVDNCRSIFVEGGGSDTGIFKLMVVEVDVHPSADASLLRTAGSRLDVAPIPIAPEGESAAEAFHVGFPQGQPAAIYSLFVGRTKLRRIGTPLDGEAIVWAEVSRIPDFDGDLAGLVGGLAMSADRRAIGIVSGESQRRGRILTTSPSAMWDVIRRQKAQVQPAPADAGARVTQQTYPPTARNLIQDRRVARLVCEVRRGAASAQSGRRR